MNKMILVFLSTILVSALSHAVSPEKVDFSKIRFDGVQVLDSENQNGFGYEVKLLAKPSAALVKTLQEETNAEIVSPIYELNQQSAFKNIYVFVTKNQDGEYRFTYVMHNSRGSMFTVDMTITNVEKDHLDVVHGASDSRSQLKVVSRNGNLFP